MTLRCQQEQARDWVLRGWMTLFLLLGFVWGPWDLAQAEEERDEMEQAQALPWMMGPDKGQLAGVATLNFGEDYMFLESSGTQRFLELTGNLPQAGAVTLAKKDFSWFAVFQFNASGYVKDDETLDPDALLEQLQEGNRVGNQERKERGFPVLTLVGWFIPPRYDVQTKHLEWGTRLQPEGESREVANFTTRLLGRRGVMAATLVSQPAALDRNAAEFKKVLRGFAFTAGERYTEFRQGDKVAEYGLAALIAGGAAAAVAKSGAGKALFKVLGVAAVAGLGVVGGLVRKLFSRKA